MRQRFIHDTSLRTADQVRSQDHRSEAEPPAGSVDDIEDKTGLTPRAFIALAHDKGFDAPATKAGVTVEWIKTDFALGRGHAMALVHVIKNGEKIAAKHVRTGTAHSDASDTLWLDGKQHRPASAAHA